MQLPPAVDGSHLDVVSLVINHDFSVLHIIQVVYAAVLGPSKPPYRYVFFARPYSGAFLRCLFTQVCRSCLPWDYRDDGLRERMVDPTLIILPSGLY